MEDLSKQPTTWSYKTTKVLLICFVFFLIVPLIGISTQNENFETLLNPEKNHLSHMIDLEHNESEIITLYPENIYTVFVKSSNEINKNEVLLIDRESQNDLKPNSTSIIISLFSEKGDTYDSVSTWVFSEEHEVELQNSAGQKIWLVNESEIFNSFTENDVFIGSILSCLTSICLIPVIIIWFVINRPNPKALNIKLITNDPENATHMELLQFQERIPTSDELYRVIHGNENMKDDLKIKIENELEQDSIPAPFTDRPDQTNIQKRTKVEIKKQDLPNVIDFPEEKPNETWKEWDG
jgi:uncharacterized protein YrzB (UPF0473 family)